MPTETPKSRAARTNGVLSRGPKTAEGEAAQAITLDCTLLPTESQTAYAALAQAEFAHWQPATPTQTQLVHELIDLNWRIRRLRFAQSQAILAHMDSQRLYMKSGCLAPALTANAEIGSPHQLPLDRLIALLTASRTRVLRDLERLSKRVSPGPGSHAVLQTTHLRAPLSWQGPNAPTVELTPD